MSPYKNVIGKELNVSIEQVYDPDQAGKVVQASIEDYLEEYGK